MDKRFVTFLAATFIVLSANMLFMRWRNADQQKARSTWRRFRPKLIRPKEKRGGRG